MNRYLQTRTKTTVWEAQKIRRLAQRRSYAQGSFGMTAEKGTDLKGKRLFRPRWITIESLANVKGMGVILHGLRPVPMNIWTVLPYCSRWLGICFCVTLVPLLFIKPKVLNVIQYCPYVICIYILKNICMIMLLFTLFLMIYMLHSLLIIIHLCMNNSWRYALHDLRPKIIITLWE
jgi:hypothetical protein